MRPERKTSWPMTSSRYRWQASSALMPARYVKHGIKKQANTSGKVAAKIKQEPDSLSKKSAFSNSSSVANQLSVDCQNTPIDKRAGSSALSRESPSSGVKSKNLDPESSNNNPVNSKADKPSRKKKKKNSSSPATHEGNKVKKDAVNKDAKSKAPETSLVQGNKPPCEETTHGTSKTHELNRDADNSIASVETFLECSVVLQKVEETSADIGQRDTGEEAMSLEDGSGFSEKKAGSPDVPAGSNTPLKERVSNVAGIELPAAGNVKKNAERESPKGHCQFNPLGNETSAERCNQNPSRECRVLDGSIIKRIEQVLSMNDALQKASTVQEEVVSSTRSTPPPVSDSVYSTGIAKITPKHSAGLLKFFHFNTELRPCDVVAGVKYLEFKYPQATACFDAFYARKKHCEQHDLSNQETEETGFGEVVTTTKSLTLDLESRKSCSASPNAGVLSSLSIEELKKLIMETVSVSVSMFGSNSAIPSKEDFDCPSVDQHVRNNSPTMSMGDVDSTDRVSSENGSLHTFPKADVKRSTVPSNSVPVLHITETEDIVDLIDSAVSPDTGVEDATDPSVVVFNVNSSLPPTEDVEIVAIKPAIASKSLQLPVPKRLSLDRGRTTERIPDYEKLPMNPPIVQAVVSSTSENSLASKNLPLENNKKESHTSDVVELNSLEVVGVTVSNTGSSAPAAKETLENCNNRLGVSLKMSIFPDRELSDKTEPQLEGNHKRNLSTSSKSSLAENKNEHFQQEIDEIITIGEAGAGASLKKVENISLTIISSNSNLDQNSHKAKKVKLDEGLSAVSHCKKSVRLNRSSPKPSVGTKAAIFETASVKRGTSNETEKQVKKIKLSSREFPEKESIQIRKDNSTSKQGSSSKAISFSSVSCSDNMQAPKNTSSTFPRPPVTSCKSRISSAQDVTISVVSSTSKECAGSKEMRFPSSIVFLGRKGNQASLSKFMYKNVGKNFIRINDLPSLILEWNPNWLFTQKETRKCAPICESYVSVKDSYESELDYYNTYFPLHLLNVWLRISDSWKRSPMVFDSMYEGQVEKPNFVKITCSTVLSYTLFSKWPRREDILLCRTTKANGRMVELFGRVCNVMAKDYVPPISRGGGCRDNVVGELKMVRFEFLCAEGLDVPLEVTVQIQVLCNIRIALLQNDALQNLNQSLKDVILDPKKNVSQMEFVPLLSENHEVFQNCVKQIIDSATRPGIRVTVVDTTPPCDPGDTMFAISQLAVGLVKKNAPVCIGLRTEDALRNLAHRLRHFRVVLAVKKKEVWLPEEFKKLTIEEQMAVISSREVFKNCHVILTLMSNVFMGDFKEAMTEQRALTCILHEAHLCTETESVLLLHYDVKNLVLMGKMKERGDIHPILKRFKYDVSLFSRFCKAM